VTADRAAGNGSGAVFDLGYKPHEGERLGRRGAFSATVKDGVRRTLGIRRKARKKVMPWMLFAIALLPVIAIVGLSFFTDILLEGIEADNPFASHPNVFMLTSTLFFIFTALAGPELLIPDRIEGVLNVYASRPMRVGDYLGARATALAITAAGFLVLPQLILYFGLATLDDDGWFSGLASNVSDLPKILLAAFFFLLAYGAPVFLVGLFADRLGRAWGAYFGIMILAEAIAAGIAQIGGASRWAALGGVQSHPVIVMDWIFGSSNPREGITNAGFHPVWSLAIILFITAVAWIVGWRRYRSLL